MRKLKNIATWAFAILLITSVQADLMAGGGGKKKKKSKKTAAFDINDHLKGNGADELVIQQLYIDASRAKMLQDFQKAVQLYKQVLGMDPMNDGAQYELAQIYTESGQYEPAREYIDAAVVNDSLNFLIDHTREALAKDPEADVKKLVEEAAGLYVNNMWYLVLQGDVLAYLGDNKAAANSFATLLASHPNAAEYYFDWAYVCIKDNDLEKALEVYNLAEEAIGLDEGIISQKQKILVELGRFDEAVQEIQKLVDANPGDVRYAQLLAELYQTNDRVDDAIKVYEKILEKDPTEPFALLNLAEIYKFRGDREKYMNYLKTAFADPDLSVDSKIRVIYPYLLGVEDSSRKEEAFDLAQIVVETHPSEAKTHALYGDLLYQDEQKEEALAQYKEAAKLDESVYEVWQQIFFILSEMDRNEELAQETDKALELFPNQPIIYFFNGLANSQLKQYDKAVKVLNSGKDLAVGNLALKVQFYSSLGDAYNNLEQYKESDKAFEEALKYDENNSYVLNNYSYYLSLRGDNLERAKEMSLKSNELDPGNTSFQDTYAWILYVSGDYTDALVWIEKAYQSGGSESAVILEHYGDILFKIGRIDDAVSYWQKALDKGSDSESLPKKIADKQLYE